MTTDIQLGELEFKPDDFEPNHTLRSDYPGPTCDVYIPLTREMAASMANALLREKLKAQPEVKHIGETDGPFGSINEPYWTETNYPKGSDGDWAKTHTARLVCIQKLEDK